MSSPLPPPKIDLLVHAPTPDSLFPVLSQLLEPSPPLKSLLAPQLHQQFSTNPPKSYSQLLDQAAQLVAAWDIEEQAAFLASHPRIGETQALSTFSSKEQAPESSGAAPTPGEVLKRLTMLNALYEESYPGLRFVTFVNGRPRAEIIPEIQSALNLALDPPSPSTPEPRLFALREKITVNVSGGKAWRSELQRGTKAMFDIAQSRLGKMGVA